MCNGGDHEKLQRSCGARNKKGGKAAAAIRGNPHSYPRSTAPNEVGEVNEFE
jgi:hypothetical protein